MLYIDIDKRIVYGVAKVKDIRMKGLIEASIINPEELKNE